MTGKVSTFNTRPGGILTLSHLLQGEGVVGSKIPPSNSKIDRTKKDGKTEPIYFKKTIKLRGAGVSRRTRGAGG